MRMINFRLSHADKAMIKNYTDYGNFVWMVSQDVYEDIVAMVNVGYRSLSKFLIPYRRLYKAAAKLLTGAVGEKYQDTLERLFDMRRDVVDFSDSALFRGVYDDPAMSYADKCETLLRGMEVVLNNMFAQQPNVPASPLDPNKLKKFVTDDMANTATRPESPFAAYGNILAGLYPPMDDDEREASDVSGRSQSQQGKLKLHDDLKKKMAALARAIYANGNYDIFKLTENFFMSMDRHDKGDHKDVPAGDSVRFRLMKTNADLFHLQKKEYLLPNDVFMVKAMRKEFLVRQYTQRHRRKQLVYVLADISGSMDTARRFMFMKSVLLSLGRKTLEDKGKLYFRFFNDNPTPIYGLTNRWQWSDFTEKVLAVRTCGGTNIHKAIRQAFTDMDSTASIEDETELVVITDGTENISVDEVRHSVCRKSHVVLLEQPPANILKLYSEAFTTTLVASVPSVADAMNKGLEFVKHLA